MVFATLVVEDDLQAAVARKVITAKSGSLRIHRVLGSQGAGFIDRNLNRFARAAVHGCYVVIRDLDRSPCAPALRNELMTRDPPKGFLFNIAVREIEAWLLADDASFRDYFSVGSVNAAPETIEDPKEYVISLARRSRKHEIKENIIPKGTAKLGQLYTATLLDFVQHHWKVDRARRKSPSLQRFIDRIAIIG